MFKAALVGLLCLTSLPFAARSDSLKVEGFTAELLYADLAPRFRFTEDRFMFSMDSKFVAIPSSEAHEWAIAARQNADLSYTEESWDCDDIALQFMVNMRHSFHHFLKDVPWAPAIGLATITIRQPVEEFGFPATVYPVKHALPIIRLSFGDWWLIEPTTGKWIKLDEELYDGRLELNTVIF